MGLNDIGKKITKVSNSVINKAKSTSQVSGLKGQISADQKRLDSYFTNLGKQYYELQKDAPLPELENLVSLIRSSYAHIADLEEQSDAVRNAKLCPSCGVILEAESDFCTNCGMRVSDLQPGQTRTVSGKKFCINCGAEIPAVASFCTKCGSKQ